MRRRNFTWKEQLETGIKAIRDLTRFGKARVLENHHTAFGLFGRDELAGFHDERLHIVVVPDNGDTAWLRLGGDERGENFPEWRKAFLRSALVELASLRRHLRLNKKRHSYLRLP